MNPDALGQIKPITKKDQIVISVKNAILAGKLESGDPIVENKIAQQLGVGTPLVREALIELEHQGFVQKVPFKGTIVTKLSRDDVDDIFRLRAELEALAIEWAKENVTEADLAKLRALTDGMKKAAMALDLPVFYENDLAFHRKIWELAGNTYLAEALEKVVVPLFAFFVMKNVREQVNYIDSAAKHAEIIAVLENKKDKQIRQKMKGSVEYWQDEILSKLFPKRKP
ncbi:MAG: GntR family transcriptional regulator [Acidobacteria bacterium]|nr:GntR family transcriptional regulator [Acidobacteriota bacterium]